MEPKFIIFWVFFLTAVPFGVFLTRVWKPAMPLAFIGVFVSLLEPQRLSINFFSRPDYTTITRGMEVGLADVCILVLLLGMILRPVEYKFKFLPPMLMLFLAYLLVIVISWLNVEASSLPIPGIRTTTKGTIFPPVFDAFEITLYPLFEFFKFVRSIFLYWVVYNYLRNTKNYDLIIYSCAVTLFYSMLVCLKQRYIDGRVRVPGNIGHANSLATYTSMLVMPVITKAFIEKRLLTSLFFLISAGAGVLTIILTISRGGMAVVAIGMLIICIFTLKRFFTIKNVSYITIGVLVFMLMFVIAFDTLKTRFFQNASSDLSYRDYYNQEAVLMAEDYFFGVGIGNFSAYSWHKYAEIVNEDMQPGTPAHNFFYLNLGELGYFGAIVFILIFARFAQISLLLMRENLSREKMFLVLSFSVGILLLVLQELLNYSFRQQSILFTFMIICAAVTTIYEEQKETKLPVEKEIKEESDENLSYRPAIQSG